MRLSNDVEVLVDPTEMIDWFDDFEGPNQFAFLSNFYVAPVHVSVGGYPAAWFATTEHAFAAAKAKTVQAFDEIRHAPTPGTAKARGRHVDLRDDWELIKVQVMRDCVEAKFTQHEDLARRLLETGGARLVEGTLWGDEIWGVNLRKRNRPGLNLLGRILTEKRTALIGADA